MIKDIEIEKKFVVMTQRHRLGNFKKSMKQTDAKMLASANMHEALAIIAILLFRFAN